MPAFHLLLERRLRGLGRGARVAPSTALFLFGDAVYEVVPIYGSRLFRLRERPDRLNRSLAGIRMAAPLSHAAWAQVGQELISRNSARDAHLYLQVTRGAERGRNHAWPEGLKPTLFAYVTSLEPMPQAFLEQGVPAVTAADIRWERRDIKSTSLLANILLKKLGADAGAFETILLENGALTEELIDHRARGQERQHSHAAERVHHILPGTTRDVVAELAARLRFALREPRGQ